MDCICEKGYTPLFPDSAVSQLNPCVEDETGAFYVPDCAADSNEIPTRTNQEDWIADAWNSRKIAKKDGTVDWKKMAGNALLALLLVVVFAVVAFGLKRVLI